MKMVKDCQVYNLEFVRFEVYTQNLEIIWFKHCSLEPWLKILISVRRGQLGGQRKYHPWGNFG
jgi:hypothetical protein